MRSFSSVDILIPGISAPARLMMVAGTAIVFGAARLIGGLPQRPSRTIRVVLFGAEEMNFSGAAYAQAHEGETGKIVVAGEADFGARNVYSVQLPAGAAASDFGRALDRIIAPLGANLDRRPARGGGDDIRELQKASLFRDRCVLTPL
jgi:hypothetical protein